MRRALAIDERIFGSEHPNVARDLGNLASLLQATNLFAEAESLMRRALAIDQKSFGTEHPNVAIRLNNLASLLLVTNHLADAEPMVRRALVILLGFERYGYKHPYRKTALDNYKWLLKKMGKTDAEIEVTINALIRSEE